MTRKTDPVEALQEIKRILNQPIAMRPAIKAPNLRRVVHYAARGLTNAEIAQRLGILESAVAYYLRRVQSLFGLSKNELTARMVERIEAVLDTVDIQS